jgi:hypothetical protein
MLSSVDNAITVPGDIPEDAYQVQFLEIAHMNGYRLSPVHDAKTAMILNNNTNGYDPETKGKQRAFTSSGAGRCAPLGLGGTI